MYFLSSRDLHTGQETGDGTTHHGPWVGVQDFVDGLLWVDCAAIDAEATLAVAIDFANADRTIIASGTVTGLSSVTTAGQQVASLSRPLPAFVRASWSLTSGKKATFRVAVDLHGRRS